MNETTMTEFKSYLWKRWLFDTLVRVLKTGAEVFLSMVSIGMLWSEIDWVHVLSVTGVAMVYTVVANIYSIAIDLDKANKMGVKHEDVGCSDKGSVE